MKWHAESDTRVVGINPGIDLFLSYQSVYCMSVPTLDVSYGQMTHFKKDILQKN